MQSNLDPAFGILLKSMRKDKGIDQKTVAAFVGYSLSNVSKWETSKSGAIRLPPQAEDVKKIANALGCDKVEEIKLMRAYAEDILREKGIDPTIAFE